MCLYPKLIKNRRYIANKKNGGVIPAVSDKRVLMVPVGCGKCMECRKKKAREWKVRLSEEIRNNKKGLFIALTFSNEHLRKLINGEDTEGKKITDKIKLKGYELDNEIATIAIRRFLERWRKKYKKSIRHWLVTELGGNGTENIHLHGVIWNEEMNKETLRDEIESIWKYGYIYPRKHELKKNSVDEKTINYIIKYVHKTDEKHKEYTSKILCSQGIGRNYIERIDSKRNKYKENEKTIETYKTRTGHEIALPIYHRNKIYTDEEREQLWLQKLDEQVRYVNGIKIDISKGDEEYYRILESERRKNKKLGYGDDSKNWDKKKYENEKRNLKTLERISKKITEEKPIYIEPIEVEEETLKHVNYKDIKNIF